MSLIPLIRRFIGCQAGVSAVEFSLLAPFMTIGAISTVDAGMAVYDKMMITQVLRAGSHAAIGASSVAEVRAILEATAGDNFTVAQGTAQPGELTLGVAQYCVCPDNLNVEVTCTSTCTGGINPNQFYDLTATMDFDAVMLPGFTLSGEMKVIAQ
ncbi:MAG: TadE/TadG family type IV pilus assembly protein [Paracoccaceae bacterium]